MRAVRVHRFGALQLDEIAAPAAKQGQILVQLHAASVNPIDWKMRDGMLPIPLPRILGRDGAGTWEGRRVMGVADRAGDGTHAEYAAFTAYSEIPDNVSFEDAAALGVSGLSAWIPLVENAKVSAGQRVLVHAGAGGVGSLAIQIARLQGAEVWTTCSARNAEWCRQLGAERAIDYSKEDFTACGPIFDVVFDIVGGAVHRRSAEVLKKGGVLAYLHAAPPEPPQRTDIRIVGSDVLPTRQRLDGLLKLVGERKLRAPVEARFPLERAAEAYELSRSGHARGKIVLTV